MKRFRFTLPTDRSYKTQDLIHDALVAAFLEAGAKPEQVIGVGALPWVFAPIVSGGHYNAASGYSTRRLRALVVSTPDTDVAKWLEQIQGEDIVAARALTAEMITLAGATKQEELPPFERGQDCTAVHWLSPVVRHARSTPGQPSKWVIDPKEFEKRSPGLDLARQLGREGDLGLAWAADRLAMRGQPARTGVDVKMHPKTGRAIWVNGTSIPFVLSGPTDSLVLAWYGGLGSKNRMGFGCWDTQPEIPPARQSTHQEIRS